MKKFKMLLAMMFCFAFIITTTNVNSNYDINSYGHYVKDNTTF